MISLTEVFNKSLKKNILILALIPFIQNTTHLLLYQWIYDIPYIPTSNLFTIKLGWISAPPEASYLYEQFPSIFYNNHNGHVQTIFQLDIALTIGIILLSILITSFIRSFYLCYLRAANIDNINLPKIFDEAYSRWFKFFLLELIIMSGFYISALTEALGLYLFVYIPLAFAFCYIHYGLVLDRPMSLKDHLGSAYTVLKNNFMLTIKLGLFIGLLFSLTTPIIYILGHMDTIGIIGGIIIISILGVYANMTVLKVYDKLRKESDQESVHIDIRV
ncbi:hypothetical protein [Vallitalea okinawensis]|uniref:hypothetical protein n=1 Tax=Vallitalea okinawensis TaxID=2078660 RepID=UPI000CFBABFD|nr:hypothetical protein [Vallitalea okinawensis]